MGLLVVHSATFVLFLLVFLLRNESDKIKTGGEGYGKLLIIVRGMFFLLYWGIFSLALEIVISMYREVIV